MSSYGGLLVSLVMLVSKLAQFFDFAINPSWNKTKVIKTNHKMNE